MNFFGGFMDFIGAIGKDGQGFSQIIAAFMSKGGSVTAANTAAANTANRSIMAVIGIGGLVFLLWAIKKMFFK